MNLSDLPGSIYDHFQDRYYILKRVKVTKYLKNKITVTQDKMKS